MSSESREQQGGASADADFLDASTVLMVAGKGGVGKTTVGATLGIAAAQRGRDVLLIELEGRSTLGRAFGVSQLSYDDTDLGTFGSGNLRARHISPDDALAEYLGTHGLDRVSGRLARTGALEVVATAAPGIRDLLALGKIRALEQDKVAEVIIVDAPAAGHAVSFLRSARGLLESAAAGPVHDQARMATEMLVDPERCQVMLVTLAEETPVNELVETAFDLEDEIGVQLAPVVVNGVWPSVEGLSDAVAGLAEDDNSPAARAGRFRVAREASQQVEIERLALELPLRQFHIPAVFRAELRLSDLEGFARAF